MNYSSPMLKPPTVQIAADSFADLISDNEGSTITKGGDELTQNGVTVRLDRPLSSELLRCEAVSHHH
jgi:hypothetical protein